MSCSEVNCTEYSELEELLNCVKSTSPARYMIVIFMQLDWVLYLGISCGIHLRARFVSVMEKEICLVDEAVVSDKVDIATKGTKLCILLFGKSCFFYNLAVNALGCAQNVLYANYEHTTTQPSVKLF